MIVYTDGLFAVENAEGKMLPERNLRRLMTKQLVQETPVEEISLEISKMVNEHRQSLALPDDVTVIVLGRAALAA